MPTYRTWLSPATHLSLVEEAHALVCAPVISVYGTSAKLKRKLISLNEPIFSLRPFNAASIHAKGYAPPFRLVVPHVRPLASLPRFAATSPRTSSASIRETRSSPTHVPPSFAFVFSPFLQGFEKLNSSLCAFCRCRRRWPSRRGRASTASGWPQPSPIRSSFSPPPSPWTGAPHPPTSLRRSPAPDRGAPRTTTTESTT